MGQRRALPWLVGAGLVLLVATSAVGFSGFGASRADATYADEMTFSVDLPGGAPERLELLLRFGDSEVSVVTPVESGVTNATYRWDAADRPITPNTPVHYRWRATQGGAATLSREQTLLYDDDRPGLDWQSARLGEATVHWYGSAETEARQFGELMADGVTRAEDLLGHALSGPIDIFVYDSRDDFFGALGPGAREWTGAAAYPELRTVFMWLGGGSDAYLETALVHEVTHIVFNDATTNPFHGPPSWFNEGLATWSEAQSAAGEQATVEAEAGSGLFAFEAIQTSFPIDDRGARLAYAQGATMVEMIIDEHGRSAVADIAAAWRAGATDAEALEVGTGQTWEALQRAYFDRYGVDVPLPIEPAPIGRSEVSLPRNGSGPLEPRPSPSGETPSGGPTGDEWLPLAVGVLGVLSILGVLVGARMARPRRPA